MRPIAIIAEIGINHCGSLDCARAMILEAKMCGADVAKFQIYVPERVLDLEHPVIREHWGAIKAAELSLGDTCFLKGICDLAGIEFLASVFHPDRVEWTEEIGMERYKIASRSMYDEDLARAIHATGKPAIISYGYYDGRRDSLRVLDGSYLGTHKIHKTLYCVSQYPAPLSETRLSNKFGYGGYDGFSDHTVGITASVVAMSLGAKIIEKHFTLDRTLPGPDQVCSIEPDELRRLCDMRDKIEVILGH